MSGRWMRGADAKVGRLLLEAGRADEPAEAKHRALVAASSALAVASLATGSAAAGVGAATGSAAASKAGIASIVSLKWLLVVGVSSVGVVAGAVALHEKSGASSPAPSVLVAPPRHAGASGSARPLARVPSSTLAHAESPSVLPSPTAPVRVAPPRDSPQPASPPPTSSPSTFSAELSALDRARALLDSGDPAAALMELDAYAARFPQGAMAPESTLLRIEALVDSGDSRAATRVADDFKGRNPKSPYVSRLRTLLEPPNP